MQLCLRETGLNRSGRSAVTSDCQMEHSLHARWWSANTTIYRGSSSMPFLCTPCHGVRFSNPSKVPNTKPISKYLWWILQLHLYCDRDKRIYAVIWLSSQFPTTQFWMVVPVREGWGRWCLIGVWDSRIVHPNPNTPSSTPTWLTCMRDPLRTVILKTLTL